MPSVRLPYCYEASFIKKGRKTVLEGCLNGEVSADVPELSSGDVRTVAEWSNQLFPDDEPLNRTRLVHSRAVSWDGGLYVPAGTHMEDKIPAEIIAKTLDVRHDEVWCYEAIYDYSTACHGLTEIGRCIRGCGALEYHGLEGLLGRRRPEPKYEPNDKLLGDNAHEHRKIVQEIVNSLVFIDGTVWKKVPSIRLLLNVNEGAKAAWVSIVHGSYGYNQARGLRTKWDVLRSLHHRFYSLNETGKLLHDIGPGIDVSWRVEKIAIHDLEAIRFNGAADYAARAMEGAVMAHADHVGSADQGRINDWLALRTAVERHRESPNEEIDREAISSLLRLLDAGVELGPARNEPIRRYVNGYRSDNWDKNIVMPQLGHHLSDQWQTA